MNRIVQIVTLKQQSSSESLGSASSYLIPAYSGDADTEVLEKSGDDNHSLEFEQAVTVGMPYMVTVSENGTYLEEFSDEPLMLQLSYDDILLEEAGVSGDEVEELRIYYYDESAERQGQDKEGRQRQNRHNHSLLDGRKQ